MQLLLEAKAKVEYRRHDDSTPLIVAAIFGHAEVVELLLRAGARLKPRDADGTALENARKQAGAGKQAEVVALLEAAFETRGKHEVDPDAPLIDDEAPMALS